ncbi:MAG: inorganic phosphate transporter [Bacteroidetes bacterium]|nr:MAG: inorganic phosphate transporter [Bacteroidota bacterium]
MITLLFFLSSGLFLGWSLGANDAANIFGTAVGSRMVKFRQAALIGSIFVILGAVIQGAGANATLGKLGSVSTLAAAFTVALSAAATVYWMTRLKLPVSTSQAIVGAIIGWNLYTNNQTDLHTLTKIVTTWISGPILGGIFAALLYLLTKKILKRVRFHLFYRDLSIRLGLIIIGGFGAYSLGANNIANVMGVFTTSVQFPAIHIGFITLSSTQQLFAIGGVAIAIGIITYSKRVMETVGNTLMPLTSEAALVVVLSQALVLFIFSSQSLSNALTSIGLPPIPLVPVSSSQIVIGSIIGIGLLKGGKQIKYKVLGQISLGWIATPVIAGIVAFFMLFFIHNVFKQEVGFKTITQSKQATHQTVSDSLTHAEKVTSFPKKRVVQTEQNPSVQSSFSYGWMMGLILVVVLMGVVYYFLLREKKQNAFGKEKVEELENYIALKEKSLEQEMERYQEEQQNVDKELKYRQNEMVNMAMNIIRKYEIVGQIKDDINRIKKEIHDGEARQALNKVILKINQNLLLDRDRESFQMHLEEHNSNFMHRLSEAYPGMTENEKRLATLLRMNLSSKEIASILNISPKSVEMNRYRLRKKLQIPPKENLTQFIRKF